MKFYKIPRPLWLVRFAWIFVAAQIGALSLHAGTLLRTDFESGGWSAMSAYTNNLQVTAAATYGGFGTILNYGSSTPSQGISFTVNSSAASSAWTAGFTSGILSLTTVNTTVTNLGLVTLSFSLSASQTHPVLVKVESYTAGNVRSGGLSKLIYPATTNFYQRFAIDLSTMTPFGAGNFDPTSPQIAISFELDSAAGGDGWPNAVGLGVTIDNVNYSTPKYYVKTGGSNSNAGTNEATAFATPAYAVGLAAAGDITVIMSGTYVGGIGMGLKVGAPDAWIVLKNYPGQTPVVRYSTWGVISISSGSTYSGTPPQYLEVRGLDVLGYSGIDANGDRYLASAYTNQIGLAQGDSNGNGISVDGRKYTQLPHDFRFADNVVEYNAGGGISWIDCDRVQVENNISRNNCWWMTFGGSGMSTLLAADFENTHNFRMLVQGNQVYGNETMVPWFTSPTRFSDGNGIILDTGQNYQGKALVQNNLSYNNGGSGIHAYSFQNAYIIHNTAYYNSANPKLQYGQIFAGASYNVWMLNNILVAPSNITGSSSFNEPVTSSSGNTGTLLFQNNLYMGGDIAIPTGTGFSANTQANPQFISPSIDPANASFRLAVGSPGRSNAVALAYRSGLDVVGALRISGISDQGAYQIQSTDCFPPMFSPLPGNFSGATTVTLTSGTAGATIVYTTNGTAPVISSGGVISNGVAYTGAGIAMSSATTLNAVAWKSGLNASAITGGNYTFNNLSGVPVPNLIIVPADIKTNGITLGLVCRTPGALVRYTLDGSTPSASAGTLANSALPELDAGQTLNAIGYTAGRANSAISTVAAYSVYANASPGFTTATNTSAIEVGTRFRSQVNGQILGLRVWHPPGASTTLPTRLWNSSGTSLTIVTGTVANASVNAWVVALVSPPINIQSNTDYIVSYSVPANYAYKSVASGLNSSLTNGALYLPAGNNGIYATSSGTFPTQNGNGTNFGADVFMLVSSVQPALFASSTALVSSTNPATLGSNVTFTVTVTSTNGTPVGTVTFLDGGTTLGTANLNSSGVGTFTTSALSVGSHSITAAYGGNTTYLVSSSTSLTQVINLSDGTTRLFAINAGGPAISGSGFVADANYTSGAATSTANTINLAAATNPAPMAVYQSERYGANFTYTFTGLTSSNACLVRLHFSENWGPDGKVGGRFFNAAINGGQRLTNFDIFATAGATNKAVTRQFYVAADGSGQVAVNFTGGTGSPDVNANVDGLEAYTVTPFDAWRVASFTPAQMDNANVSGLTADPDGDGMINFVEYALGTNPLVFSPTGQPTAGLDGNGHLTINFFRARSDVTYIVESCGDLSNPSWNTIVTNPGTVGQSVTVTDTALPNTSPRFLRVKFVH